MNVFLLFLKWVASLSVFKIYLENSVVFIDKASITKMESGTKITTDYAKFTKSEQYTAISYSSGTNNSWLVPLRYTF
jgi:hypothetical protein